VVSMRISNGGHTHKFFFNKLNQKDMRKINEYGNERNLENMLAELVEFYKEIKTIPSTLSFGWRMRLNRV